MIKDSPNPTKVDYIDRDNQLEDNALFIGFTTCQKLLKLEREGDISSADANKFFEGIRQFYKVTVKCIFRKVPMA